MAAAIGLRSDFDGTELRRLARGSADANQTRRLLALVSTPTVISPEVPK